MKIIKDFLGVMHPLAGIEHLSEKQFLSLCGEDSYYLSYKEQINSNASAEEVLLWILREGYALEADNPVWCGAKPHSVFLITSAALRLSQELKNFGLHLKEEDDDEEDLMSAKQAFMTFCHCTFAFRGGEARNIERVKRLVSSIAHHPDSGVDVWREAK